MPRLNESEDLLRVLSGGRMHIPDWDRVFSPAYHSAGQLLGLPGNRPAIMNAAGRKAKRAVDFAKSLGFLSAPPVSVPLPQALPIAADTEHLQKLVQAGIDDAVTRDKVLKLLAGVTGGATLGAAVGRDLRQRRKR